MTAKQNGRPDGVPEGFGWATEKAPGDWQFTVRELTVKENDQIFDSSKKSDGTIDDRANLRMALVAALVKPSISIDDIDGWPGTRLSYVAQAFNKVNSVDLGPNPLAPPTGSGETSPSTGAPSPQS